MFSSPKFVLYVWLMETFVLEYGFLPLAVLFITFLFSGSLVKGGG